MVDKTVTMFDSPEAATYRTDIKGWVSANGSFYGDNEHIARWSGCTHMTCECGNVYEKGRVRCDSCQSKADTEKFMALPMVEWDGVTPVCIFGGDRYFFSDSELLDWMEDLDDDAEVRLVLCEPGKLHTLDVDDWCDDLPEDGDLPAEVQTKLDELNEAIKNAPTVCWWEGKARINAEPLWSQVKEDK